MGRFAHCSKKPHQFSPARIPAAKIAGGCLGVYFIQETLEILKHKPYPRFALPAGILARRSVSFGGWNSFLNSLPAHKVMGMTGPGGL